MSTMEQALRDEIAWHEAEIDALSEYVKVCDQNRVWHGGAPRRIGEHNVRLAALTAALPAPGVEAPGDWVMVPRVATEAMKEAGNAGLSNAGLSDLNPEDSAEAYAAMLAAAPSAPTEISQAQAQAMRAALTELVGQRDAHFHTVSAWDAARAALTPEPPR